MTDSIQELLDSMRRSGKAFPHGGLVRELSSDGSAGRIVYSRYGAEEIVAVIQAEIERARSCNCTLEWKVYSPDVPLNLSAYLKALGFVPEVRESVLALGQERGFMFREVSNVSVVFLPGVGRTAAVGLLQLLNWVP